MKKVVVEMKKVAPPPTCAAGPRALLEAVGAHCRCSPLLAALSGHEQSISMFPELLCARL